MKKKPSPHTTALKNKIKALEADVTYWRNACDKAREETTKYRDNAFGKHWFTYKDGCTKGVAFSDPDTATPCQLDRRVVIVGRISAYSRSKKDNEATFELKEVYLD